MGDLGKEPLKPVRASRMFTAITDQLLEYVERNSLRAGDRLPREADIADSLNVSRPTLRQALRVLESAGVLTIKPGQSGGIFVRSDVIPISLIEDPTPPDVDSVPALLRTRHLVEPIVAHLAAEHATPDELDAIAYTLELLDRHRGSQEMVERVDGMYHRRFAIAAHDEILRVAMYSLYRKLLPLRAELGQHGPSVDHMIDVHTRQYEAVRNRDHDQIDALMKETFLDLEQDAAVRMDYEFRWCRTDTATP